MANTVEKLEVKTRDQVKACGYDPIEMKGKGSYGLVYEVGDLNGELFAFKYIIPKPEEYKSMGYDGLNEIDILTRVNHPNIIHAVKVLTPNECKIDGMAIILPLAQRTLYDIYSDKNLTTHEKLPIIFQLASALDFLHSSGILHLDIKGQNVVLQDNIPYFIDFGLSLFVDDSVVGIYNDNKRVTIDHRAPEILSGSRIYNASVDIWAFGIMVLYLLISGGIYDFDIRKLTDSDFLHQLMKQFSSPNNLSSLLKGISPLYNDLCTDLLSKILQLDPTKRITAKQITEHAIFDHIRHEIKGQLEIPAINYNYGENQRNYVKIIVDIAQKIFGGQQIKLLFLGVDLFNRTSSFYKDRSHQSNMVLATTCLWLAYKLITDDGYDIELYIKQLLGNTPNAVITAPLLLSMEIAIISILSGILNVSALYSACKTVADLQLSYTYIIVAKDSTLYAKTDIPEWIKTIEPEIKTKNNKYCTIEKFFG